MKYNWNCSLPLLLFFFLAQRWKSGFCVFALILGSMTYRKRHMGNAGLDQSISIPCLGNSFLTNPKMVLMKLNTNSFTCYVYPKASIDSKIYANKNAGVLVSPQGFFNNLTSRMSFTNQLHPKYFCRWTAWLCWSTCPKLA